MGHDGEKPCVLFFISRTVHTSCLLFCWIHSTVGPTDSARELPFPIPKMEAKRCRTIPTYRLTCAFVIRDCPQPDSPGWSLWNEATSTIYTFRRSTFCGSIIRQNGPTARTDEATKLLWYAFAHPTNEYQMYLTVTWNYTSDLFIIRSHGMKDQTPGPFMIRYCHLQLLLTYLLYCCYVS